MIDLTGPKRELAMTTSQAETIKVTGIRQRELRPPHSSYAYLITMLVQGWQIEPPVYVRPRWHLCPRSKKGENTYHFVLWREDRVNLVSVLDCPEVQQFLADNELVVDRL